MEEGPEPQEWVERSVEHHHESSHAPEHAGPAVVLPAITAAVLAVCAAVGSLLSGHSANRAIIFQTQAADQWAYFQSKSTKGHIYEASKEVISALTPGRDPDSSKRLDQVFSRFDQQLKKYEKEKKEAQEQAERLEQESERLLHQHHQFAVGIAAFQVAIVLSSISILVRFRPLYLLSLAGGAMGMVFIVLGLLT